MSDSLPQHLGRKYEVDAEIRTGGMGTIYRVRHRELDVIRVVKVLRTKLEDDSDVKVRFKREARAAAKLQHPNVVQIHDFSFDSHGHGVIEMEYINGVDLGRLIEEGHPLSLPLVLEISRQCLNVLAYLHENQIVHRDISPDNFMLTKDLAGQPLIKIIDLGIAKHYDRTSHPSTEPGVFLGKLQYASPEHFSTKGVETRSDIYSFGVVFYELLTGSLPIRGEEPAQLMAGHLSRPPLEFDVTDAEDRVPRRVRALVMKALAKSPAERFFSADQFGAEIKSLQSEFPLKEDPLKEVDSVLLTADSFDQAASTVQTDTLPNTLRDLASPFVVGLPIERDEEFFGRSAQRGRLRDFIGGGQSVQILGVPRMGKTSLLRWVARHAAEWQDRPVVWVNAQGLTGQSPQGLVLSIAEALDRRSDAERVLANYGGDSSAAARVLDDLLPLVLLIDEASVLAQPQHGFDVGFLGALRTFCQDLRLVWVSNSFQDIRRLFRETGLASRFLNDARVVWVGQLEDVAARDLVMRLGEDLAEVALREAGGFAFALQWLGDALWRDRSDPEATCDVFAEEMRLVFDGWWASVTDEDQSVLKKCVSEDVARDEFTDRLRRRAQRLKRRGFLSESAGRFVLPGTAWRNFVWDRQ